MKQTTLQLDLRIVRNAILSIVTLYSFSSCEDFISVESPTNQLVTTTVFEDELTAKAAMLGVYAKMGFSGPTAGSVGGISNLAGLSSDELKLTNPSDLLSQFYENNILSTNSYTTDIWNPLYEGIYYCNSLIEGLDNGSILTNQVKSQFKGEALFLRAYSHFYLVNLYGKIPYITTTNYEINTNAKKMEIEQVYQFIIDDLLVAKNLLPADFSFSDGRRTRASRFAASALLAKVYLFIEKNAEAEIESSIVIDDSLFTLENVEEVFLMGSREAIWQLGNRDEATYTNDGEYFAGNESKFNQSLTDNLIVTFEPDDLRRVRWIQDLDFNGTTIYIPYKYKDNSSSISLNEKNVALRLGEQYLIRAEARAKQDKLVGVNGAVSDLNEIRGRAGLSPLSIMSKEEMLDAILVERSHEMFMEMGNRWLDLKRLGKANDVLTSMKIDWESTDVLYPIPYEETVVNRNLVQNDGYN